MNFISPFNLLWMLPIGGAIVVMYILKLRRKDVIVSSTFLWRQVVRDVQANAPFQKLRKNLLLLLQLIAAALLIFALARPFLRMTGAGGRNIVLIVDTSASMRATDIAPSRLEAAKRKANDIIGDMRLGDQMMIVSAYSRPTALTGFTSERSELNRAINSLQPHDTPTNMRDALNLAADLVASRNAGDSGVIELISDGGFEGTDSSTAASSGPQYTLANLNLGKTHVEFHPIGAGNDNVGITAVDFRRNLGAQKSVQILVVTHNFSAVEKKFTQEIYAEDNLLDAHEVVLAPGAENTEPYDIPEPEAPTKMRVHLDLKDDLAVDNEAVLILKPRKTLKVLLVGGDFLWLDNALKVDPSIDLSKAAAFPAPAEAKKYDVVIFNEAAPAKLPEGNYLFLHCLSDQCPAKADGFQDGVTAADWEREHPILRYVDFNNEVFDKVLKASPLGWGREIVVGDSGSLVIAGEKNQMRAEFVAFSLKQSRFPLAVAFPIFIPNSVHWLGTGSDDSEIGQTPTGSPITIPAPPGAAKLTITKPDGSKRDIAVGDRGGAVFDEVDLGGIYTAEGKDFSYPFAANLASASESNITPHKTLTISDNPLVPTTRRVVTRREILPLLALLALLLLLIEWYIFHRRVNLN